MIGHWIQISDKWNRSYSKRYHIYGDEIRFLAYRMSNMMINYIQQMSISLFHKRILYIYSHFLSIKYHLHRWKMCCWKEDKCENSSNEKKKMWHFDRLKQMKLLIFSASLTSLAHRIITDASSLNDRNMERKELRKQFLIHSND